MQYCNEINKNMSNAGINSEFSEVKEVNGSVNQDKVRKGWVKFDEESPKTENEGSSLPPTAGTSTSTAPTESAAVLKTESVHINLERGDKNVEPISLNTLSKNVEFINVRSGFANGDIIVTLLPVNSKWPWVTAARFRPELVPEELMAQGLTFIESEEGKTIMQGWEQRLDVPTNDIVIQGTQSTRLSRKQGMAEQVYLRYLQRWGKDFLRRRLDWTLDEEGGNPAAPRHLTQALCPCQYVEEERGALLFLRYAGRWGTLAVKNKLNLSSLVAGRHGEKYVCPCQYIEEHLKHSLSHFQ
ncbi:unnamed protein product [Spodoptera exigua]|nr:unnamed protein product [Spodoptera exigua]